MAEVPIKVEVPKEFLAQYTVKAFMYDGGAWMPDPEPHHVEYRFRADDPGQARARAEEHLKEIRADFFGARITLDTLLEVREVPLEKNASVKL